MKSLFRLSVAGIVLILLSFQASAQTAKYKCMLQMSNYMGEGAYVVVSLVNAQGEYEKTLYVMGDDKKWYKSLTAWHKYYAKKQPNISAITGASVTGGDRSVTTLELDESKLNKGYTLRFETSVEDQKYYTEDVVVPFTTEGLAAKTEGKGYIRYVRLSKVE